MSNYVSALANKDSISPSPESTHDSVTHGSMSKPLRVCIIGAGIGGLFTAMIFDYLNNKYGLCIDYEILEANCKERLGGRLYTYYFKNREGHPKIRNHDYIDMGAMRFPAIDIMKSLMRAFDLFEVLGMKYNNDGNRADGKRQATRKGQLIPYYLNGINQPTRFNNVQIVTDGNKMPQVADFKITNLPKEPTQESFSRDRWRRLTAGEEQNGTDKVWRGLVEEVPDTSFHEYLKQTTQYDSKSIEFLITMNLGTRRSGQALSEIVLENFMFDNTARWWCVEGGAQQIAYRMWERLEQSQNVNFQRKVIAMSFINEARDEIDVTVDGQKQSQRYDAVFNSAPLGSIQRMDLDGLNLGWDTRQALLSANYQSVCKVGVRFRSLWWIHKLGISGGGQGTTDLPIRCCVYPSYNIHDNPHLPGVLLVSYTFSQDADRMAQLINQDSPGMERELKALILRDLAKLHSPSEAGFRDLHRTISEEYLDHYAWSWGSEPLAGGVALFGPEQFQTIYPSLIMSNGNHIIIGEAASPHHEWVVGALDSAVRGVYQFLRRHSSSNAAVDCAREDYERNKIPAPFGPLPAEYNRDEDTRTSDSQSVSGH
ncbi:hypothetical protein PG987_006328 [Apiospora arundinis]